MDFLLQICGWMALASSLQCTQAFDFAPDGCKPPTKSQVSEAIFKPPIPNLLESCFDICGPETDTIGLHVHYEVDCYCDPLVGDHYDGECTTVCPGESYYCGNGDFPAYFSMYKRVATTTTTTTTTPTTTASPPPTTTTSLQTTTTQTVATTSTTADSSTTTHVTSAGRKLGHMFKRRKSTGRSDAPTWKTNEGFDLSCATHCHGKSWCRAFTLNRNTQQCALFDSAAEIDQLTSDEDVSYYE